MAQNFEVKDAKAQLETRCEHVDDEAAECDDPAPAALGVIVLAKRGRFPVTPEGCKRKKGLSISYTICITPGQNYRVCACSCC